MADEKGYAYVVLAWAADGHGGVYARLGDTHLGRTPEEAIGKAAQDHGMPVETGGEVVAIPASKFHVRTAERKMEPTWEIVKIVEAAERGEGEGTAE